MPAAFQEMMDRAKSAVDRTFAERVLITPRTRGSTRDLPGADPSRSPAIVMAVIRGMSSDIDRGAWMGGSWNGDMPADHVLVHIRHENIPGYDLDDGDRLQALDRPGQPTFEAAQVDRTQLGRVVVRCTPL